MLSTFLYKYYSHERDDICIFWFCAISSAIVWFTHSVKQNILDYVLFH